MAVRSTASQISLHRLEDVGILTDDQKVRTDLIRANW
jgi:hypothetical protein